MPTATDRSDDQRTALASLAARPLTGRACGIVARLAEQPAAEGQTPAPKTNGGRWRLYGGDVVLTQVWGVEMRPGPYGMEPAPIRMVVDLSQASFERDRIAALQGHWESLCASAGVWSSPAFGKDILADLTLIVPRDAGEAAALSDVVRLRALLDAGFPVELSIGFESADGLAGWEKIAPGATLEINGRSVVNDDPSMPMYVVRHAVVTEASFVYAGASDDTGRVAAARVRHTPTAPHQEPAAMLTAKLAAVIAALAASFPNDQAAVLGALGSATEDLDEAGIKRHVGEAVQKAELARLRAENAKLTAAAAEKTAATPPAAPPAAPAAAPASAAALAAAAASASPARAPGSGAGAGGDAPATVTAAMEALRAEGSKLKGFDLRAAALKRWPELRKSIPKA